MRIKLAKYRYYLLGCVVTVISLSGAAGSSDDLQDQVSARSAMLTLKQRAFRAVIAAQHPEKITKEWGRLVDDLREPLFEESVNRALGRRLGLSEALKISPPIPLESCIIGEGAPRVFSRDSTLIATSKFSTLRKSTLHVQNVPSEKSGHISAIDASLLFQPSDDGTLFVAFNSDNTVMATTMRNHATRSVTVCLIDVATGRLIKTLENSDSPVFSADRTLVATSLRDRWTGQMDIQFRDIFTGETVRTLQGGGSIGAFSQPDKSFASYIAAAGILRYATRIRNSAGGDRYTLPEERIMAFSKDGSIFATLMWNETEASYFTRVRKTLSGEIMCDINEFFLALSPDGAMLVTTEPDRSAGGIHLCLRDISTGNLIRTIDNSNSVVFNAENFMLATSLGEQAIVHQANFREALSKIKADDLRMFLLDAAQSWLNGEPYKVSAYVSFEGSSTSSDRPACNSAYQTYLKIIELIPYLNHKSLFDVVRSSVSSSSSSSSSLPDALPSEQSASRKRGRDEISPAASSQPSDDGQEVRAPDEPRTMRLL